MQDRIESVHVGEAGTPEDSHNPIVRKLLFAGIVLLAAALRLVLLARDGLWADECQTIFLARIPLGDFVAMVRDETQTPGYILLIKGVRAIFGETALAMRLPSAIFGTAAVGVCWAAASRLLSPLLAPIAAFLLAVSPMAVHYSQEARAYGLMQLLVLCGLLLALRVDDHSSWRTVASLTAVFLAMLYTHNIGVFFVIGIAAASLIVGGLTVVKLRRWTVIAVATGVGYVPWLKHIYVQLSGISTMYSWADNNWASEFPWQVPRSLAALTHGSFTPIRNRVADIPAPAWIALVLCVLLAIAAFAARGKLVKPKAPVLLLTALILPLTAQFLYCWIADTSSYTVGRNDAPALPILILLVTAGVVAISARLRWLVPVAFAGLAFQPLFIHYAFDFRSQEKNFADYLNSIRAPNEVVMTTAYHYSVNSFVEPRFGAVHLLYPTEMESHPSWADWSNLDRPAAEEDARAVIDRAVEVSRDFGEQRIWILRHVPNETAGVLVEVADRQLDFASITELPDLKSELYEFRVE